jgi:hypothetical protein
MMETQRRTDNEWLDKADSVDNWPAYLDLA